MKKNTKIVVILIIAFLMLVSIAFIWKSYTDPIIADDYTELIIPDGYTELNYSNRKSVEWDRNPPYEIGPSVDYPYYTLMELMEKSDLIISGRVLSFSESKWSTQDGQKPEGVHATPEVDENGESFVHISNYNENKYIYTDMDVQVDTIHKGKLDSETITIRLPSGTVGEFSMSREGGHNVRNYNVGDEVFLVLIYVGDDIEDLYYLPLPQCAYVKL